MTYIRGLLWLSMLSSYTLLHFVAEKVPCPMIPVVENFENISIHTFQVNDNTICMKGFGMQYGEQYNSARHLAVRLENNMNMR